MSPVFLSPARDHFSIVLVLILLPVNMQFKAFRGSDARHTHRGNLEYSKILHGVWERGCGHQIQGFPVQGTSLPGAPLTREPGCDTPQLLGLDQNPLGCGPRTGWKAVDVVLGIRSVNFWKVPTGRGTAGTESSRLWRISLENSRGIKV